MTKPIRNAKKAEIAGAWEVPDRSAAAQTQLT